MPKGIKGFQKGHPFHKGGEKNWFKKGQPKLKNAYKWGKGKKHHNWGGGKKINSQGYILILKPSHPFCDKQGYVRKHRLVMEHKLGRFLKPKEIVHHKGIKYPLGSIKNKQDNRIKNLQLFATDIKHHKFHRNLK